MVTKGSARGGPFWFRLESGLKSKNVIQFEVASRATLAQSAEQCFRKAKVPGSNPGGGSSGYSLVVECDLPKVEIRVRFPLPAPAVIIEEHEIEPRLRSSAV